MSAATVRDAAEMVPIEHETSEQVVRTLFFVLPPVALALGGWLAWGGTLHWQDLVVRIASTIASQTALGTRTVLTPTIRRGGEVRCKDWVMRTLAGCSAVRRWPTPLAMPRICSPTAICSSSVARSRFG